MKTEIKPVWNVYDYSHNDNEMRVYDLVRGLGKKQVYHFL